jgi:1-acyl-sn-glycerol-3-phosphate acyltransferase
VILYYLERSVLWTVVLLFIRFRVKGKNHIPRQGPFLLVSNHLSYADPILLGLSFGRRVTFMGKEELFRNRLIGGFLRHLGAISVNRGRINRDALRQAEQVLKDGKILAIFPEGHRSQDLRLQPALPGPALIALRTGVPILPVSVAGTQKVFRLDCLWRRPVVTLVIGESFRLPQAVQAFNREHLEKCTDLIMRRIASLLPPDRQGQYLSEENK